TYGSGSRGNRRRNGSGKGEVTVEASRKNVETLSGGIDEESNAPLLVGAWSYYRRRKGHGNGRGY
ncbi:hypothetical protein KI387_026661, partial [Taxus chinensis]